MYITGIANRPVHLNKMDGDLFKTLGYEITRKMGGDVISYSPPRYPLNYFRLEVKIGEKTKSVLLHEYFPYVAIALYDNELQMHFLDEEDMMKEWKPYYTVLDATFLNAPFHADAHDLSEIELKNAKHWRANTNGEVIFNCWD